MERKLYEASPFANPAALKKKREAEAARQAALAQASPEEIEAERKRQEEQKRLELRKRYIDSIISSGRFEEFKRLVRKWVLDNTNLTDRDFDGDRWSYYDSDPKVTIGNDLTINVKKDLVITGDSLASFETYVVFGRVDGNLTIGASAVPVLPNNLPREVGGNFMCTKMINITSLVGAPTKVEGNYIVQNCPKLASLDGAPASLDDFSGFFLCDKFSNDDFYQTVENGGIMPTGTMESVLTNKKFNKLVESRIALGQYYKLNEAFSSKILSSLAKNPANADALNAMKKIKLLWSEIPDEIIVPIRNNVSKLLAARRPTEGNTSAFGLTICCDKDGVIKIIGTGNNKAEWKNETWLYVDDDVIPLINKRVNLVKEANYRYENQNTIDAREALDRLGINWGKSNIIALSQVRYKDDDMKFPHLYLIPEFCAMSYVIKGVDDREAALTANPSFARDFTYRGQQKERDRIAAEREEAMQGAYGPTVGTRKVTDYDEEGNPVEREVSLSTRNVENDPAFKKYRMSMIDDDLLRRLRKSESSVAAMKNNLRDMKESVANATAQVRRVLLTAMNNDEIPSDEGDLLYERFLLSTQREFAKYVERKETDLLNYTEPRVKPYADKLFRGKEDPNNKVSLSGIQKVSFPEERSFAEIIAKDNDEFYSYYRKTLEIYAEILAALNAYKRGNKTLYDAYIAKLKSYMSRNAPTFGKID